MYGYGFRGYYAAIGRFTSIDPAAESSYSKSPYSYASNNFVNEIDYMGLWTCGTGGGAQIGRGGSGASSLGSLARSGSTGIISSYILGGGFTDMTFGGGNDFGGILGSFMSNGGFMYNLTVVNSDGVIIYHDPYSEDHNIYLTNDPNWTIDVGVSDLEIIGTEFDFANPLDKAAFYQVGMQLTMTDYNIGMAEVVCEAAKPATATDVLKAGSMVALVISQLDGPEPFVADAVAAVFEAGVLIYAGYLAVKYYYEYSEHKSNIRPSSKNRHQDGVSRKKRDKRGGEKGDDRRPYRPK
jgi:hypothetical protein